MAKPSKRYSQKFLNIFKHISIILSLLLIGFSILIVFEDISRYGIVNGIFRENTFVYVAYTYNIIFFALFLSFLIIRNKLLALPIFLISYSIWDGVGILKGLYTLQLRGDEITDYLYYPPRWHIPYYQYQAILFTSIILGLILYKEKLLNFKVNTKALIFCFLCLYTNPFNVFLEPFIPRYMLYSIGILTLCFFSIKPYNKDSQLYHKIILDPDT